MFDKDQLTETEKASIAFQAIIRTYNNHGPEATIKLIEVYADDPIIKLA